MSDMLVQIDVPNQRDLSRLIRLPAIPSEGDSIQLGDVSGVVKTVVWFIGDGTIVRIVVSVPVPEVVE